MSNYFEEKFAKHIAHSELTNAINIISSEGPNETNADASNILHELFEVFLMLQEATNFMDKRSAIRLRVLDHIHYVATNGRQSLEYYKEEKDIADLIDSKNRTYEALQFLLNDINSKKNKNILESLEKLFKFVEGIEPAKIEASLETIDFPTRFKEQEDKLKELSGKTTEKMGEVDKKLDEIVTDFNDKISTYSTEAKTENEKLKELHGIVAGESFTGGYGAFSESEEKRANIWRISSIGLIFLLVVAAILTAIFIPIAGDTNTFIGQIIKTFSIAGALIYASAFAIKQANQHRRNASRAKWLAVGINAVGAFTGTLDEKDKQNARFKMIEVILNQQEVEGNTDSINKSEIVERLRMITDLLNAKS